MASADEGDSEFYIPHDKPYAVVEMKVDGECYATPVASAWLHNAKLKQGECGKILKVADCHWPTNENQLSNALERKSKPKEDWTVAFQCRIMSFNKTLLSAKETTERALETSDISGSDNGALNKKRTSKTPSRYSPQEIRPSSLKRVRRDDTDSLDESSDDEPGGAPKIPERTLQIAQKRKGDEIVDPSRIPSGPKSKSPKEPLRPVGSPQSPSQVKNTGSSASPVAATTVIESATDTDVSVPERSQSRHADTDTTVMRSSRGSLGVITPTKKSAGSKSFAYTTPRKGGFSPSRRTANAEILTRPTFMREMSTFRTRLDKIEVMLKKIYRATCPLLDMKDDDLTEEDGPTLPLQTEFDLNKLETYIKDRDNKVRMVRLLTDYAKGMTMNDSVKALMPRVLSNALAATYNMDGVNKKGLNPKRAFKGTRCHAVVLAAIKCRADELKPAGGDEKVNDNTPRHGFNVEALNSFIGNWLKNAPKRLQVELKKKSGNSTTASENPTASDRVEE